MSIYSGYAEPPSLQQHSPPVPIIATVIFLILFFFGFFTAYFCRCILEYLVSIWNRRNPSGAVAATAGANMSNGLDPELIQAFPTFFYSTVKEFRSEKYGLECAICLGEFKDDDMLRLLTICCHVFHMECVDLWLESHKTCPVCRRELDVPRKSLEKSPIIVHSNSMDEIGANQTPVQDAVCIDIKEDDDNEKANGGEDEAQTSSNTTREKHYRKNRIERFSRSYSTGHSISRIREEKDRYTLRLLDHAKIKIFRGHNSARSCIAFGDFTSPSDYRNGASGEASETCRGDMDRV
ncbi:hypothetical protein DITRI_Ditri07aG0170600 [Diplodiscus trichospermus]